jgi:methionyl-tRNA formyltransferase
MTSNTPLRVGVLVGGESVPIWKVRALNTMLARTDAEITHVVVRESAASSEGGAVASLKECADRFRQYPLWSLVGLSGHLSSDPAYNRPTSLETIDGVPDADRLRCRPEPCDGLGNTLPRHVVEEVGAATDVLVRFGFGILKGEILTRPTHGVLSYHFGDIREYRGQAGGLREYLNDEPRAGVTLQRLTETLDGGAIVAYESVDISDAGTWQEVRRRQAGVAEGLLATGVRNLTAPGFTPREPESLGKMYTLPTGTTVLRYVAKNTLGKV